ncbi:MAG: glycosyltransferase [Flavobacterium sp.]
MIENSVTCIIIPCYNEQKGLMIQDFLRFIDANPDTLICFVNDGSSDNTQEILENIKNQRPNQVYVLTLEKNSGKAEAVRQGINYCNEKFKHQYIGYLDADLATTLEEFIELESHLKGNTSFAFGSRIMKIGSNIQRNFSRFLIGRIIATFISRLLELGVYDTQCGAKIFTREISTLIFKKKFISRWLFDVELFYRMKLIFGREKALEQMLEIPLKQWIEKGDSKVKFSYGFKLWFDLYEIGKKYKANPAEFI